VFYRVQKNVLISEYVHLAQYFSVLGSGMLIPDPIFSHTRSRIQQKRGGHKFHKIENYLIF
jgi:hypothetical protein